MRSARGVRSYGLRGCGGRSSTRVLSRATTIERAGEMTTGARAADFTLSVEFAGICLYVVDRQQRNVSVLMPVADGRVDEEHEDKTDGIRHVPYLLADLANITPGVPAGLAGDGPQFG